MKGGCVKPVGDIPMLHRHKHIRLDSKHGTDHEGSSPERQLHDGLHGCQEAPGDQPWPFHHWDLEAKGRGWQEWQVCEGSGHPAVRNSSPVFWLQSGGSPDTCQQDLQDDQTRPRCWRGWPHCWGSSAAVTEEMPALEGDGDTSRMGEVDWALPRVARLCSALCLHSFQCVFKYFFIFVNI